jgi:hypothetical protein
LLDVELKILVEQTEAYRIWRGKKNRRKSNSRASQRIIHRVKSRKNRLKRARFEEKFGPHYSLKDFRRNLKTEGIRKQSVTEVDFFTHDEHLSAFALAPDFWFDREDVFDGFSFRGVDEIEVLI